MPTIRCRGGRRRRTAVLLLTGALLSVTGCLELTQEGKLHRDGTLDLDVRFTIHEELLDRLQLPGSDTTRDLEALVRALDMLRDERACRKWFEERRTSLARHESTTTDGRHDVHFEVKTSDFRHLLTGRPEERRVLWFSLTEGPAPKTGELLVGGLLPPTLVEVLDVTDGLEEAQRDLVLETMRSFTDGTTVSLRMTLPGPILESELPREGANTVVLALDYARWKSVEDLRRLFRPRRVVWDASEMTFPLPLRQARNAEADEAVPR